MIIGFCIWIILTILICRPTINYIVDETNKKEMAFFVFPTWVAFSLLIYHFFIK